MRSESNVLKAIKKYGVAPAVKRDCSLFTTCCIARGYTEELQKIAGISYNAVGGFEVDGEFQSLINVPDISEKTEKLVSKGEGAVRAVMKTLDGIFSSVLEENKHLLSRAKNNPFSFFERLLMVYPTYFSVIGFYNCFFRYFYDSQAISRVSPKLVKEIGRKRNTIGAWYPPIERAIHTLARNRDGTFGTRGEPLRYFTYDEMEAFVNSNILPKTPKRISERVGWYVYLLAGDTAREYLSAGRKEVNRVVGYFSGDESRETRSDKIIRGVSAYGGLVKGEVKNFGREIKGKPPGKPFVLVATHTQPKDIQMIKTSSAIVVEEGSLLSHAAITARELKIPCIVGARGATQICKDGDIVEVNGYKGVVKIIERA